VRQVHLYSRLTRIRLVVCVPPNVRAKPRVPTPAETAQGPGTGGVQPTRLRRSCLAKSTTYAIGSWRAGDDGRTPGPATGKCTPYPVAGPGGLPLALRLSEGLGRTRRAVVLWGTNKTRYCIVVGSQDALAFSHSLDGPVEIVDFSSAPRFHVLKH